MFPLVHLDADEEFALSSINLVLVGTFFSFCFTMVLKVTVNVKCTNGFLVRTVGGFGSPTVLPRVMFYL